MRIGLFGDVHGEAARLRVVIDVLHDRGLRGQLVCLGDLVAEGDERSNECVAIVKEHARVALRGNHDDLALHIRPSYLSKESLRYLEETEEELVLGDALLVHENPLPEAQHGKGRWWRGSYVNTTDAADAVLERTSARQRRFIVGHAHVARVYARGNERNLEAGGVFRFDPAERYVFVVGATGYSRDGNPAPCCAIYDDEEGTFEILRPS